MNRFHYVERGEHWYRVVSAIAVHGCQIKDTERTELDFIFSKNAANRLAATLNTDHWSVSPQ